MIASGLSHSLFIDSCGLVWASGRNNKGQLGLGHTQDQHTFCHIEGVPLAVQVSAADYGSFSAILDDQGDVWMFGSNESSQTGILNVNNQHKITSPTKVQNLPRIVMVSCGNQYTILLDGTGYMWGAGDNNDGQLGIEGQQTVTLFTQIITPKEVGRIIQINCGATHTMAKSNTHELWGTGNSQCGQLGVGNCDKLYSFQRIPLEEGLQVQSFSCGLYHTAVLDQNGGVWTTGLGFYGELGLYKNRDEKIILTKVPNIAPMMHVICGGRRTLMINKTGQVFACGDNYYGQLGAGDKRKQRIPLEVLDIPKIVDGSLSFRSSLLIDYEGGVWVCGDNSHGQHGTEEGAYRFAKVKGIMANVISEKRFLNTKRAQQ